MLEREVSEVTGYPSGLAVSPDGRWLVSLGFSTATISVYDASTLDPLAGPFQEIPCPPPRYCDGFDPVFLVHPHAAVIAPDGSFAMVTSRNGVFGFDLPSLDLRFYKHHSPRGFPRQVVRDRAGGNYYVGGEDYDVALLTPSGEVEALFEAEGIEGLALTRNERSLLVLTEFGSRLVVLSTPNLVLQHVIDLPFEGEVVVPLKADDHVIVVGGAPREADTAALTPLMALPVDLATGSTGSLQVLCCETTGGQTVLFGDGNQWADVGLSTAVVPTSHGTVVIDTDEGTVDLYLRLHSDAPCCDIASYPTGDRAVMANAKNLPGTGFPGGSLIVYEIHE